MPGPKVNRSREDRESKLQPWKVLQHRDVLAAAPWITVSVQKVRLPGGRVVDDYHQIKISDFTVIYAETSDGGVVVERQYKHGVGRVTLTLPAGSIEEGETSLEAARRELLEETGYRSDEWQSMGSFVANGNYGCGSAQLFVARNCSRMAEPASGDLEEMEILLMEPQELLDALRDGRIGTLSSAAAIAYATNPLLRAREE